MKTTWFHTKQFALTPFVVASVVLLAPLLWRASAANQPNTTYVMPLSAHDLGVDQRYETFAHVAGIQAEGKDFRARRHKSDTSWPEQEFDGADKTVLSNWIIYGNSFYAMGAGTVVGCWRNAPENTPGSLHADFQAGKFAGGGNHLWILQDDGVYALYAHAKLGSIPAALCPHNATLFTGVSGKGGSPDIEPEVAVTNGAKVKAGQFLGLIGNSGASSGGPHLHVHMEKDGVPVVMTFDRGMTTPFLNGIMGLFNGPWTRLNGKALPKANILVWAPHPIGNYTFNGTPAAEYQSLFDHMSDSGMMPDLITCKSNGATYNVTWIPSKGTWRSHYGMFAEDAIVKHATYTAQGYQRTSSFTCGSVSVAVWRK
jgi:hypothetical protein